MLHWLLRKVLIRKMLTIQIQVDERLLKVLTESNVQLKRIGDGIVSLKDELQDLVQKFDAATNAVAARIDALKQKVLDALNNPNTLSESDKADIEAALNAEVAKLQGLGSDPENPVPAEG